MNKILLVLVPSVITDNEFEILCDKCDNLSDFVLNKYPNGFK